MEGCSLEGYFKGLKALVPLHMYFPEYPRVGNAVSPPPLARLESDMPVPIPYIAQSKYQYGGHTAKHHQVVTCYLDKEETTPAPNLYAYKGAVQSQPEAVVGSRSLLGIRDDVCFDRFGRYGPYGLGYSLADGGLDVGMDTENAASDAVWAKTGKIEYTNMNWGDAQDRCYEANKKRFTLEDGNSTFSRSDSHQTTSRTAVVVRAYVGVDWTPHAILNLRALISEVSLRSGGEYQVHFLLHVRDDDAPIWADAGVAQQVLDDNVPAEFHDICTLWSEPQMRLLYPGGFNETFDDPSNSSAHGVYRGAHLPLQHFAVHNPQYAHFWNWEMDMRWLGNYYELFDRLDTWARDQTRVGMWERAQKYYLPHYHGSWDNFTRLVDEETAASGHGAIFGPVRFPGFVKTHVEKLSPGGTFFPPTCRRAGDDWDELLSQHCGVGEDADLITLNPIFDAEDSAWVFSEDVTGYDTSLPVPPRRSAIITASRMSRRLLEVMHEETWRNRHHMFTEMFPATMALHHGLKAVFAPHPIYLDREWPLEEIDGNFNGGRDHSTSGSGSPFNYENEHNLKGATWYYHSAFAGQLWRRWLGYAQMDGRGPAPGNFTDGALRGGREEEERAAGTGRMCLRSMLLHPIKWEHPEDEP